MKPPADDDEPIEFTAHILRSGRHPRPAEPPAADFAPFRPTRRPPIALLCVLDDGKDDGEWHRLRGDRTVIGRHEGDILIPHDEAMSATHAVVTRHAGPDGFYWTVADADSTNGLFGKVRKAPLVGSQHFLIGSRRLRFESAGLTPRTGDPRSTTVTWEEVKPESIFPTVVVLGKPENRVTLKSVEAWIGRDAECDVCLADDPMANGRHARLALDAKNRWILHEAAARSNGVWVRLPQIEIVQSGMFQLGEQRFILRVAAGGS